MNKGSRIRAINYIKQQNLKPKRCIVEDNIRWLIENNPSYKGLINLIENSGLGIIIEDALKARLKEV